MSKIDLIYKNILASIMQKGVTVNTRNSECTRLCNIQVPFTETPLVSLRKTFWKGALREFEWFLSGSSNIKNLHPSVHKWWLPWADESGNIPNNYSEQFRNFCGIGGAEIDQVNYLQESISNHPYSRRAVITTWNTADMLREDTPITNCHGTVIQCFVNPDNTLDLTMYQRSSDMVLGWQHNLIQYWAFLLYLAHHADREVGKFTWIGGDCHIYSSHYDMVDKIIFTGTGTEPGPELIYNPTSTEFLADDFTLSKPYQPKITDKVEMIT